MVTGVPVLAEDLTGVLAASTLRLLLVGVAVMALVLALLFRARLRLLPLVDRAGDGGSWCSAGCRCSGCR